MQRQALRSLATALVFGSAGAFAQDGGLAGVTMRVLDDLRDVDAVVLDLDASRGDGEAGAANDTGDRDATADEQEPSRDDARRDAASEDVSAERTERASLHDVDADERGEGRLEDRDVERPGVPPAAVP